MALVENGRALGTIFLMLMYRARPTDPPHPFGFRMVPTLFVRLSVISWRAKVMVGLLAHLNETASASNNSLVNRRPI